MIIRFALYSASRLNPSVIRLDRFYISCLLMVIFINAGSPSSGVSLVENIKVWKAPSHVRIVLDMSTPVKIENVASEDPTTFCVDLRGAQLKSEKRDVTVDSGIVTSFIIKQRILDTVRVTVHLKNSAEANVYQISPYQDRPPRVVIKVEGAQVPSPEEVFHLLDSEAIQKRAKETIPVVVIDPGHGGMDPGALGPTKIKEKDAVLDVARYLEKYLCERGKVKPVLTRVGDYYVTLRERMKIAEQHGASLFISLHTNASKNRRAAGTSVFILSLEGATDEAATLLAEKENAADMIAGEYESSHQDVVFGIVVQMKQTAMINESGLLASVMLKNLKSSVETVDRGVRQAGFAVLKSMMFPSVLIELAFITNRKEERLLKSSSFKKKLATALGAGIEAYVSRRFEVVANANSAPGTIMTAPPKIKEPPPKKVHTVKKGDTLWEIGRKYRVSISDILKANHIKNKNKNKLRPGQKLLIPSF